MLFAPRDTSEAGVIETLVRASHTFARPSFHATRAQHAQGAPSARPSEARVERRPSIDN